MIRPWLRVGSDVWYYPPEDPSTHRAAIVTEIYPEGDLYPILALTIFCPAYTRREPAVRYGPGRPGCWSYAGYGPEENHDA